MLPGYNTNGFAHHRLEDALKILASLGYRSVALTPDVQTLNPLEPGWESAAKEIAKALRDFGLQVVVETGARFILDPWRKHQPTLLSNQVKERKTRLDYLLRSARLAEILGSNTLSFWSGNAPPGATEIQSWDFLVEGCVTLLRQLQGSPVRLAFEPEPGMFIETMAQFEKLFTLVDQERFGLTLDIGHLECLGETPLAPHANRWADRLWNIHLSDMRRGLHDHVLPGEGSLDFAEVFAGLRRAGYQGGIHWELSRHSHNAVETARLCHAFLRHHGIS
ncbi:MAG: sugar phosphate isomerase/epimerase [Gemmataceae bacterium]|nr:sugar phosphate isomerase/epimerase [Gemmataceae bacterium]